MREETEVELLIVEDDPNDAELMMRVLRKHNLANKVTLLRDGAEALDFLFAAGPYARRSAGSHPKVVFMDLKLPKVDGVEVLRRMRADDRTKTIPVVVLTSSREPRDLREAYDVGANSFVTKPVNYEDFSHAIRELGLYWLILNRPPEG